MDAVTIILGCGVLFALLSIRANLYKSMILMWYTVFGLYLALWNFNLVIGFCDFFPPALEDWKIVIVLVVIYLAIVGGLSALKGGIFKDIELKCEFPTIVNYIGGILSGLFAGMSIAMFLLLVLLSSPLKDSVPMIESERDAPKVIRYLLKFSDTVNAITLQDVTAERGKLLLEELLLPPKEEKEETKSAEDLAKEDSNLVSKKEK